MELQNSFDAAYQEEVRAAESADLTIVQSRNIVVVVRDEDGSLAKDSDGNAMVMLIPSLIPNDPTAWEKTFQLFLLETRQLCQQAYRVVYFHSGFSPPLWFAWWLVGLRSRLSRSHRKNISALTVVHPSIAVRLLFLGLRPILGTNFWRKLHYADRIEELWLDDVMSESVAKRSIPRSVFTYEGKIAEEAEIMREAAIQMGAPLARREESAVVDSQQ